MREDNGIRTYEINPVLTECAACYEVMFLEGGEVVGDTGTRPFYHRGDAVEAGEKWVETGER